MWNIVDYGADSTGVKDSTNIIQSLLNLASGAEKIVIPEGTFQVGQISIPSNSRLTINGTLFLKNNANTSVIYIPDNATNIHVEGSGTIDGNKANNTTFGPNGNGGIVTAFNNNQAGQNVSDVTICGLTIQNCLNWAVNLSDVTHARISNCKFINNGNSAQAAFGASDVRFIDCEATGTNDIGIAFYGGCVNCQAVGCISHDNPRGDGIAVLNDSMSPTACHDILIVDCVCYANGSDGINVFSNQSTVVPHYNVQITGNDCYANNTLNQSLSGGIGVNGAKKILIENNNIHDNGNTTAESEGIMVANASNVQVLNNKIGNVKQSNGFAVGVRAYQTNNSNINVANNTFYDDQTTATTNYSVYVDGGSNIRISNNNLDGNTVSKPIIEVAGGSNIVVKNNDGYNPVGLLTAPNLPASGIALVNPFPFPVSVYISGGNVSSIDVNVTATNLTNGTFYLDVGWSITLHYATAPTSVWMGM